MTRRSRLTHHSPGRTSCPSAPSHSSRTSVTRMVCSLSRVTSACDSKVFLPSGAARGALRFQRQGVFWLIPSNNPGHKRWTSPRHRGMPHCRSVLHWWVMSRNQSRTMGLTWTLRRFAALLLGSSSASAAAGVGGGEKASARRDSQFSTPDSDVVFCSNVMTSASQG